MKQFNWCVYPECVDFFCKITCASRSSCQSSSTAHYYSLYSRSSAIWLPFQTSISLSLILVLVSFLCVLGSSSFVFPPMNSDNISPTTCFHCIHYMYKIKWCWCSFLFLGHCCILELVCLASWIAFSNSSNSSVNRLPSWPHSMLN